MTRFVFSRHAVVRAQQRGITPAQIDAIIQYADMECPRGDGRLDLDIKEGAQPIWIIDPRRSFD